MNFTYPARILTPEESWLQSQGQKKLKIYQDFMQSHINLTEKQEMRVFSLRFNETVSADMFAEELKKI